MQSYNIIIMWQNRFVGFVNEKTMFCLFLSLICLFMTDFCIKMINFASENL